MKLSFTAIRHRRARHGEHPPTPGPEPEPLPPEPAPPAPEPDPPTPEPTPAPPQEWNIWELERLAKQNAAGNGARHEELDFLLLELRQFANAEGRLPVSFDPVVRESFGDLVYSPS